MSVLADLFREQGAPHDAAANRPFLLRGEDTLLYVHEGAVDVFAVKLRDGALEGPRRFVTRVGSGRILSSVGGADSGIGMLAVAAQNTELSRADVSSLTRFTERPEVRAELARAIDGWIAALSAALAPAAEPTQALPFEPDMARQVKPGATIRAAKGVVWIQQTEGTSEILSSDLQPVAVGDTWLPLSGKMWVRAATTASYEARNTDDLIADGSVWAALRRFHAILMGMVERAEVGRLQAEQDQIRRRQDSDKAVMDKAIVSLASAMETTKSAPLDPVGAGDPLVEACRLVADHLGVAIDEPGHDRSGDDTADDLNRILRSSRVRARRVALREAWWTRDNGPLLAFTESDASPIALLPHTSTSYDAIDPSSKRRTRVTRGLAEELSSFAFMLYQPFPARAINAWEVLKFGFRASPMRDVVTVLAVGITVGLLALFTPIATGIIFDNIIPSGDRRVLLQLALALTVMTLGSSMFQLTRGLAVLRIESKMAASVQAGVWDRLLTLPPAFFRDYLSGDLANRSLGIDAIRRLLTGATVSSLLGGIFSVFSFALLFYYSARLALVATGIVLVAVAATLITGIREVRLERALLQVEGRIEGLVLQFITGMSKLRVAGAEARAFSVWAREFAEQRRIAFKAQSVENGLQVFNAAFPLVASICVFAALAMSISDPSGGGALTTGSFLAFNAAFGQFVSASLQLSSVVVSLLSAVPLYERAKPILETPPEVDLAKADPGELSGTIELSHVSFRYHSDGPLVLDDVSIHVNSGEFIAVVGPSGAGKSSVLRLLLGFETPENGSVYYDGQDLATLDVQSVRRQTGVVLQNAQVLPGTIFENIVGSSQLTHEDAAEAAKMAGLDQDIEQMPMGMHTVIVEGGGTLSGGQRQRLLIARAVVGRPRMLLFDEATSALDNRTQAHVSASLDGLHTTRVVIAHRLSTIVNADRIYVMDKGKVVQEGTYEELMAEEGLFADLARRQLT